MTTLTRWILPALAVAALVLLAWLRPGIEVSRARGGSAARSAEPAWTDSCVAQRILVYDLEHRTRANRMPDSVLCADWIVREHAGGMQGWRLRGASDDLTREILLELHPSGAVKRFLFPPGLDPTVEAFWQEWADAVLVVRPDMPADRWTTRGEGPLGPYVAEWERSGDQVTRVRSGYSGWRSEDRARFHAEGGEGMARLRGRVGDVEFDITKTFRFLLREESFARPELASTSGRIARRPGELPEVAPARLPVRALEELLDALHRLDVQGWDMQTAANLYHELVMCVDSERFRALLQDASVSFRIKELLLDALGEAGEFRVLADLIAGPDRDLAARALFATWNLREPGDEMVRVVGEAVRTGPPGTEFFRHALRAAGRMSLIEEVRGRKSALLDDDDRAAYLDALGSARSADVFEEVRSSLSSDVVVVRVAAVGALASSPHRDAGATLLRVVETETWSPVVVEAVYALAERGEDGPEVRSRLSRLATDPREEVRLAVADYFETIEGRNE